VPAGTREEAQAQAQAMCDKLLVNAVMEKASIEVL